MPRIESAALQKEIAHTAARVSMNIILKRPTDPEDYVVLHGSTERLIELAEACKDN